MPLANFLNCQEAAAELGVSGARVRQMLLAGQLIGTKVTGAVWLIPLSEVQRIARKPRQSDGRRRLIEDPR